MKTTGYAWQYEITWYTDAKVPVLTADVADVIVEKLPTLCEEHSVVWIETTVEVTALTFVVASSIQQNMSKVLRGIQKKLTKQLGKQFSKIALLGDALWQGRARIITDTTEPVGEDLRIQKILKSLSEVAYYDLFEVSGEPIGAFRRYIASKQMGIVEWGDRIFLVDKEALKRPINLNCFECTKIYKYGCCCGSPCDYGTRNKKVFDTHAEGIAKALEKVEKEHYDAVMASGGMVDSEGVIGEVNGRCALLVAHEGVYKCIVHKYGLDEGIPIYEVCPLSCLLYPLEILELITDKQKKVILFTSVLEDDFAKRFGRWGSYSSLDVDLRCLSQKAHDAQFKEADYKPIYEVNKGLLTHEFGPIIYEGITKLLGLHSH